MTELENKLSTDIMEAILAYIEGEKSFRSVLSLGITAHSKSHRLTNETLKDVIAQLSEMGNQMGNGKKFSKEQIRLKFTTFLEELTKD